MVATATIGAGVLGAGASMFGASQAGDAQVKAAEIAAAAAEKKYQQQRADLAPYMGAGSDAINKLMEQIDQLTKPFQMTQDQLEQTPGYQFNLSQGLKAVQNSATARGLGVSGAALKGAAGYASGLADSTYMNQYNIDQANKTNAFNKLMGISQLGQSSGAGVGASGMTAAQQIGNAAIGAGNGQAAAYNSMGQAVGSAANSAANGYLTNRLMSGMYGNSGSSINFVGSDPTGMGGL